MAPQKRTTLVYSFVARGAVVLADHAEVSGNFASVAAQCLQKLPSTNNRHSYNCDGHTFNYLVEDGFSEFLLLLLDPMIDRSPSSARPRGRRSASDPQRCVLDLGFSMRVDLAGFVRSVSVGLGPRVVGSAWTPS